MSPNRVGSAGARVVFVTGAGTDIGKTYVTAAIVRGWRAAGRPVLALKPLASGVEDWPAPGFAASDTAVLLQAQGLTIDAGSIAACSPWRFTAALAPDLAAAAEGRAVHLSEILDFTRRAIAAAPPDALVLVEGVGGVMSPITAEHTVLDWIAALGCPALLVCGGYLGAVSHGLTAHAALAGRGVPCLGLMVNESPGSPVPLAATEDAFARFLPDAPRTIVRRGEGEALAGWVSALLDPLIPAKARTQTDRQTA